MTKPTRAEAAQETAAFTLIELLVVIATSAIPAALLQPALSLAKEHALTLNPWAIRSSSCCHK